MRKFEVVDCEQGSPDWFAARLGIPTGSEAAAILGRSKKRVAGVARWVDSAGRADYKMQLLCERLTGKVEPQNYITKEMRLGTEREPFARMAYEVATRRDVRQTGFLRRIDLPVGCSLDGDVDDFEGIVEIKSLKAKNHLAIIDADEVPEEYMPQITHNLFCSGANWCDFVSYCPEFPSHLQLFWCRVKRDEAIMQNYRAELVAFIAEVDALERKYSEVQHDFN